jgi:GntR family transcriptional regulator / MocR family aminotransferase
MKRHWEFVIDFDRQTTLPPFLQIARQIADEIRRGRLRPADRLPGSRQLAATLRVHRNTILAAYAELIAEGWLETARGRGTFVARAIPEVKGRPFVKRLGTRIGATPRTVFDLPDAPAVYRPPVLPRGTLNLSSGSPDIRLVPVRLLGRAYRRVMATRGRDVLSYGDPEGHPMLRSALASMLAINRGLSVGRADVFVTRGSQMALALVARALLRPGDVVAVEQWGYRPAWEAFRAAGATVMPVPIDGDGIDVEALRHLSERRPVRAVYLTPHHQYPTTVTLKAARRIDILAMAQERKVAIIEDDYDHEFHYDGRPVLPLASADRAGVVVYIGTLSKILAPGLRVGYIVAPPELISRIAAIRSLLDIQGDLATEAAVAQLIEDGEVQRHVARVRRDYARRRDTLAAALTGRLGDAVDFTVPPGGMAIWIRFRTRTDVEHWARRSLEHGVSWYPGRRYAFDQLSKPFARFSFAYLNESELVEAVKRLAAARV